METVKKSPPEQRIVLRNVSWETYEHLLVDHANSSAPRFAYDRGTLEIMSPSPKHEETNRNLAQVVEIVAEESGMDMRVLGSMTFRREDLERGFEPDSCFYIQNEKRIRGKEEIDPTVDPPPDLIIEVDITSPSLPRFPIYARFGILEVWRYNGERVTIFGLRDEGYAEAAQSSALPPLTGALLSRFVEESTSLGRTAWMRRVREWARSRGGEVSRE